MTLRALRQPEPVADGFSFLEGPRWHDGRLYVSDFGSRRVLAFDESGAHETVCEVPGQPSGLGVASDGSLLVVSMLDRRLLRRRDGELEEIADLSQLAPGPCNDMILDDNGCAYVGNFGAPDPDDPDRVPTTCLVRVDPDGGSRIAATDLVFPNGAVIPPGGRTLLIAETFASRISAFDVAPDGALSNRRTWARFGDPGETVVAAVESGLPLPDGMAHDAEGALWIGHAAGRGALRVLEGGTICDAVDTGDLAVYAVALGGADRRTLFMCAAPPLLQSDPENERRAVLLRCRVDVPGSGLP